MFRIFLCCAYRTLPSVEGRKVQRRLIFAVLDVGVRPVTQEHPYHPGVAVLGGTVEGGLAVTVLKMKMRIRLKFGGEFDDLLLFLLEQQINMC